MSSSQSGVEDDGATTDQSVDSVTVTAASSTSPTTDVAAHQLQPQKDVDAMHEKHFGDFATWLASPDGGLKHFADDLSRIGVGMTERLYNNILDRLEKLDTHSIEDKDLRMKEERSLKHFRRVLDPNNDNDVDPRCTVGLT
eukprot:TRINITY_DN1308_c0_g1_i5.p1 TRINITY_DN1308_c0_g1~~TRINITY_DN1308_c0_g1_i5.p1  ORF type:complete len:141 (-),score=28.98 TRINITY_DN1308_c0_g1_i5:473-895(-)